MSKLHRVNKKPIGTLLYIPRALLIQRNNSLSVVNIITYLLILIENMNNTRDGLLSRTPHYGSTCTRVNVYIIITMRVFGSFWSFTAVEIINNIDVSNRKKKKKVITIF